MYRTLPDFPNFDTLFDFPNFDSLADFTNFLITLLSYIAEGKKLDNLRLWINKTNMDHNTSDLSVQFVNFLDCIEIERVHPTNRRTEQPNSPSHQILLDRLEILKPLLRETIKSTTPPDLLEKYLRRFSCTAQQYVSPHIKIISPIIGLDPNSFPVKVQQGSDEYCFLLEIADVVANTVNSKQIKNTLRAILYDIPSQASYDDLVADAVDCPQLIFNKFMAINFDLDISDGKALEKILQLPMKSNVNVGTALYIQPEFGFLGMNILSNLETLFNIPKIRQDYLTKTWRLFFQRYKILRNCSNDQHPFPYPEELFHICLLSLSSGDEITDLINNFDFNQVKPDETCVLAWLNKFYGYITYDPAREAMKQFNGGNHLDTSPTIYIIIDYLNERIKGISLPLFLFAILEAYDKYKQRSFLCNELFRYSKLIASNASYMEAKLIDNLFTFLAKDCGTRFLKLATPRYYENSYKKIIYEINIDFVDSAPPLALETDLRQILPRILALLNSDGGLLILHTISSLDSNLSLAYLELVCSKLTSREFLSICTIPSIPQENLKIIFSKSRSLYSYNRGCIYIYCLKGRSPFVYQEVFDEEHFYIYQKINDQEANFTELKDSAKLDYINNNFPLAGM